MDIRSKTIGFYILTIVLGTAFFLSLYWSEEKAGRDLDKLLNFNIPLLEEITTIETALVENELNLREYQLGADLMSLGEWQHGEFQLAKSVARLGAYLPRLPTVTEISRHVEEMQRLQQQLENTHPLTQADQALLARIAEKRRAVPPLLERLQQYLHSELSGTSNSNTNRAAETKMLLLLFGLLGVVFVAPLTVYLRRSVVQAEQHTFLSSHDPLTALPNRQQFEHTADQLAHSKVTQVIGLIKLDQFKMVTAGHGYDVGDVIIQQAAARILERLPRSARLFRFDGPRFGVTLPFDKHEQWLADICTAFERPLTVNGAGFYVTVSVGYCISPDDGESGHSLIKNADASLVSIGSHGGNKCQHYTHKLAKQEQSLMLMKSQLRQALVNDELLLHYQPQVDANTGKLIGMEALLRWQHPQLGNVSPRDFIPLAEQSGLIAAIGEWVIREACFQIQRWQRQFGEACVIAVNVSPRQFLHHNFLNMVTTILKDTGVSPSLLELEITENVTMENAEYCISVMHELKRLGVQLSIDDFGTGFSSMNYLKRFCIDKLKIDKSFVRDLAVSPKDEAIVRTIIDLAHNLGLMVVAEGVETDAQRLLLRRYDCEVLQGYLISHPQPAVELSHFFQACERNEQVRRTA